MKNFEIGKEINTILNSIEELKNKVYPIVVVSDKDVKYPFAVYRRKRYISANDNKDTYDEEVFIEINIATQKYVEGINLANKVCETFLNIRDNKIIDTVNITNLYEFFGNNEFVQTIELTITIK